MRALLGLSFLALFLGAAAARQTSSSAAPERPIPGKFTDVTSALGVHFNYLSNHTPKHYLPETMGAGVAHGFRQIVLGDRKSTRLNSSHDQISYAVFCLKKKKNML